MRVSLSLRQPLIVAQSSQSAVVSQMFLREADFSHGRPRQRATLPRLPRCHAKVDLGFARYLAAMCRSEFTVDRCMYVLRTVLRTAALRLRIIFSGRPAVFPVVSRPAIPDIYTSYFRVAPLPCFYRAGTLSNIKMGKGRGKVG